MWGRHARHARDPLPFAAAARPAHSSPWPSPPRENLPKSSAPPPYGPHRLPCGSGPLPRRGGSPGLTTCAPASCAWSAASKISRHMPCTPLPNPCVNAASVMVAKLRADWRISICKTWRLSTGNEMPCNMGCPTASLPALTHADGLAPAAFEVVASSAASDADASCLEGSTLQRDRKRTPWAGSPRGTPRLGGGGGGGGISSPWRWRRLRRSRRSLEFEDRARRRRRGNGLADRPRAWPWSAPRLLQSREGGEGHLLTDLPPGSGEGSPSLVSEREMRCTGAATRGASSGGDAPAEPLAVAAAMSASAWSLSCLVR